jgi:hypothetical protein
MDALPPDSSEQLGVSFSDGDPRGSPRDLRHATRVWRPPLIDGWLGAGLLTTAVNIFGHHRKAVFPRFLEELFSE